MYRFKKSIGVSYNKQGQIFFTARRYEELPPDMQQAILALCKAAGGDNWQALFAFVTTSRRAEEICRTYYLSKSTLYRAVRRFYERFPDRL